MVWSIKRKSYDNRRGGVARKHGSGGIKPREQETEARGGSQQFADSAESPPLRNCASVSRQTTDDDSGFRGSFSRDLAFRPETQRFLFVYILFFFLLLLYHAVERGGNGFVRVSFLSSFPFFSFFEGESFCKLFGGKIKIGRLFKRGEKEKLLKKFLETFLFYI